ncbi:MAG: hypothetical protein R3F54_31110 [Alphaproteobacteria bacterium]
MDPRFVTKTMHAFLDYPVALSLAVLPFALQLGGSHPLALWLAVIAGVAAFLLTVFTDHRLGLFRVIPYRIHVAVDLLVGVLFLLAPFAFGFGGIDAWYYWANAIAVITVASLSEPGDLAKSAPATA